MKVSCSQDIKNLPQELQTNTWVRAKHLNMNKIYWHRSPYERMQYLRHRANESTKGIRWTKWHDKSLILIVLIIPKPHIRVGWLFSQNKLSWTKFLSFHRLRYFSSLSICRQLKSFYSWYFCAMTYQWFRSNKTGNAIERHRKSQYYSHCCP